MGGVQLAGVPGLRSLVVLGATGSIGAQALDVADRLGCTIAGLAANRGSRALVAAAEAHSEAVVVASSPTPEEAAELQARFGDRFAQGPGAVAELAAMPDTIVINGIVGVAGLASTVAGLAAGNRVGLANKESLVAGAAAVHAAQIRGGGELIPIDSEHSALHQLLAGEELGALAALILTASGGPFRKHTAEQLESVTVAEALQHPNWDMGDRITIDSATLMNKGFEVIEAHALFDVPFDDIEVLVHPQSVVHGLVRMHDGAVKAHLGSPDMRIPIQYAITHPERAPFPEEFELAGRSLDFEQPDTQRFPALRLAYEAGRAGGAATTALNAADEVAVHAFLRGDIGFTSIPVVLERVLTATEPHPVDTVEAVLTADTEARSRAREAIGRHC